MTTIHRPDDVTCEAFADALSPFLEGELDGARAAAVRAHAAGCAPCGALLADLEGIVAAAGSLPPLAPSRDLWAGIEARIAAPVVPLADRAARPAAGRRAWRHPALAAAALVLVTSGVTYVATRWSLRHEAPPVAVAGAVRTESAESPAAHDQAAAVADLSEGQARVESDSLREAERIDPTRPRPTGGIERAGASASLASRPARAEEGVLPADGVYGREITRLRAIITRRSASLDPTTVQEIEQNLRLIDSAIVRSRAALARDPASGFLTEQLTSALERKVELLRTAATLPARS